MNASAPTPEGQYQQFDSLKLWLPPSLFSQLIQAGTKFDISPMVFLRKAVELHENHRSPQPVEFSDYRDQEKLRLAYETFKSNQDLQDMYQEKLQEHLDQLDKATASGTSSQNLDRYNITTTLVPMPTGAAIYAESMAMFGEFESPQAFGIAATLELIWLYSLAEEQSIS